MTRRGALAVEARFAHTRRQSSQRSLQVTETSSLAIPAFAAPTLPVADGNTQFPVRRVFCVGRNYAAHAREMGADPQAEPPFFFMKPATAVQHHGRIAYPTRTEDYHHEVELVVALSNGGRDIPVVAALDRVFGYGVGLDLTRRDVQAALKKSGKSWEMGKCADQSAPVSAITPVATCGHPASGAIRLTVNDRIVQQGDLADMILDVPHIIAELSTWFELMPGDLLFTGTPEGVGPLQRGDHLLAEVSGLARLELELV
ncbi:MAG: fumarylacetoacetate hydrolase family protein [Zoogloeaceae bacterium]|nr:fumarylacetoacetate hydrolase family protein [Zoogloeaceae bacterium]MCP5295806.1 fumarylacetoacetate hydrolase family protein [Zoogloeaceae bacterium]